MINRTLLCAALLLALLGTLRAQATQPEPGDQPATSPAATTSAPAGKVLKFPHIRVDLTKREIVMQAEICRRKGPLELLVCSWGTKLHESILQTHAKGSHLHAALLALDLAPGIPAQWSGSDEAARFLPPRGPEVKILARWKDKQGKAHEEDVTGWFSVAENKKAKVPATWVFTGSEILGDGTYLADLKENGHIVSVSNFPDAVLDVPFESTSSDADLQFVANSDSIPPLETAVDLVFQPVADAEKSPYARVLVEVRRNGQFAADGKPVSPDELTQWAEGVIDKHPKAQVVLRADGKALVHDVEIARHQLRYGGIHDVRDQLLQADDNVLPRTPEQFKAQMKDWSDRFAKPRDYIRDPYEQSQEVLGDVQRQLAELDRMKKLWEAYGQQLRKDAEAYRATSQPTSRRTGDDFPTD
jgi:biopolymer transport protein ExbD